MNLLEGCCGKNLCNELSWLNEPAEWGVDEAGKLTIVPQGCTDFFRPLEGNKNDNACLLYKEVTGDFTLVTRTRAELVAFGDAAAVTVRSGEDLWAKICLERSPTGDISVVSVVTNPYSDDANGERLNQAECCLRLTRKGDDFGMHYSLDGVQWRFVRAFALPLPKTVQLGVHAQSPFQVGCRAEFDFIQLTREAVNDFRSGD
jgi:regulation of enolase protein 1 (concanavalin A-like superfamily)